MIPDVLRGDPSEFIALAAGEDGERDLFRLGGGEDEEHVLGRFLQRFQQRVEGLLREHVHFVDDVHLFRHTVGSDRTDSFRARISSMPRFEAASISYTSRRRRW